MRKENAYSKIKYNEKLKKLATFGYKKILH